MHTTELRRNQVSFLKGDVSKAIDLISATGMNLIFLELESGQLLVEGGGDVVRQKPFTFSWRFKSHLWEKV